MKHSSTMNILIALTILVFSDVCIAQVKAPPFSVIKITTIGNEDLYYNSDLLIVKRHIPTSYTEKIKFEILDSVRLLNDYTYVKILTHSELTNPDNNTNIKLSIKTPKRSYHQSVGGVDHVTGEFADTIDYVLDYSKLDFKEKEFLEEQSEKLHDMAKELAALVALKYEIIIEGESHNSVADFLYEEGFDRTLSTKRSTLTEIFTRRFFVPGYPSLYYTIIIKLWHSYGYGKQYYDVSYECCMENPFYKK